MSSQQKVTLWEFFQSLGKTFMLPVALLSFCGIMLGIGSSLTSPDVLKLLPILNNVVCITLFTWMKEIGSFAFTFLPAMFTIAIPLGLVRNDKGVAAFAGFVGYVTFNLGTNFYLKIAGVLPTADKEILKTYDIQTVLGIESINTGILGAIFVGIIVYRLHQRFHAIRLPDAFAFFGGNRFVPIITALTLGAFGVLVPIVWPWFAALINGLGALISQTGIFAPMLFGSGERLLLPFGLHHILVALIRFTEAGGTMEVCNETVRGALLIYQKQLACVDTTAFSESATRFLSQGKMPSFLGGLPGAALAMYVCAKPEQRHKVKGLMISGVVACIVGGITEPLEFLFLFVAPVLYLIHAVLTGLGFMVMGLLGVTIGNTDGNVIDLVVSGILQGTKTKWYLAPVVAAVWFVTYFLIFRFAILRFNFKTPGREDVTIGQDETATTQDYTSSSNIKGGYNIDAILAALGGTENIITLDNCITRLRMSVKDISLVDDNVLKANKALGIVRLNQNNLQVIIGPQVQTVKDGLQRLIERT